MPEVPAPHVGLAQIEGRTDFETEVADRAGNVARPRAPFNARIKLAAPIVDECPGNVDCRQPPLILNGAGHRFGVSETALEPIEVGDGREDRAQLQSNVDPLSKALVILRQVGERLQRRLEEGACRLIGRKLNRLVAGLTQIVHGLVPERSVEGVVGEAFDHIKRVVPKLRFHAAQHARMEHLPLRRDQ